MMIGEFYFNAFERMQSFNSFKIVIWQIDVDELLNFKMINSYNEALNFMIKNYKIYHLFV